MRRRWFPFLVVAVIAAAVTWSAAAADDVRQLTPRGRVNDFAGVMTPAAVQQLEAVLEDLERRTGAQVAVVTVGSVPDGDADRAAVDLFQAWGIGQRGQDNGVLILCAIQDRRARIEVGYGLEGLLPDALVGRVMDTHLVPALRRGDYSAGLLATTLAVAQIISRSSRLEASQDRGEIARHPEALPLELILLIIGLLAIFGYLMYVQHKTRGSSSSWDGGPWTGAWGWGGGFSGYGGGGGFGGFGGGLSGGGGAGRGW